MASLKEIEKIIIRVRAAAIAYYRLTGKPLGITGEVGEYEAARLLDLKLAPARAAGYDAVDRRGRKLQVKARRVAGGRTNKSQRVGAIELKHPWDAVLLVMLDEAFLPTGIWEADRRAIEAALKAPGSKARNERGALAVSKFKSIGRRVWQADGA